MYILEHPNTRRYLEFPSAPISIGGTCDDPSQFAQIDTGVGNLGIITPTQTIIDRLIATTAWDESESLEQALLVVEPQREKVDW